MERRWRPWLAFLAVVASAAGTSDATAQAACPMTPSGIPLRSLCGTCADSKLFEVRHLVPEFCRLWSVRSPNRLEGPDGVLWLVVGYDHVRRLGDGGRSWQSATDWARECRRYAQLLSDTTVICWDVYVDLGCRWAGRAELRVQRSDDGGHTWRQLQMDSGLWPDGMWWESPEKGYVHLVVEAPTVPAEDFDRPFCVEDFPPNLARTALLVTRDGGDSWSQFTGTADEVAVILRHMECDVPARWQEDWVAAADPSP